MIYGVATTLIVSIVFAYLYSKRTREEGFNQGYKRGICDRGNDSESKTIRSVDL